MDRAIFFDNLASAARRRYKQLGKLENLEECMLSYHEALVLRPPGHPLRSSSLHNLASAFSSRYKLLGKIEDIEKCISLNRDALGLRPPGHPLRSTSLVYLALALSDRYDQLGEIEDLEESLSLNRDALGLCPPGHPDHSSSCNNLAMDLSSRYELLGKIEDLEESVLLNRDALGLCPPGHPDHSLSLNNLAASLSRRYNQLGEIEDLEESISLNREALGLCPPGHPGRSSFLNNLAASLGCRYDQLGEIEDLKECISLNREALGLRPPGHPHHSTSLTSLAASLGRRYDQLGEIEDLKESISLNRDALGLCPPGHPDHSLSLNNLADALSRQYEQLGQIEDLEECISLNRDALGLCPPGDPLHSTSLTSLAASLGRRYQLLGKIEDLEESISLNRDALGLRAPGHSDHSSSCNNLAMDLSSRYELLGKIEDLEECISLNREALGLRPPGHPHHSTSLTNLAASLGRLYELLGKIEDLEESILLNRDALGLRQPGHPDRSLSLNNLAIDLSSRYELLGKIEDLEECISLNREALGLRLPGHPHRSLSLNNLAIDLNSRYEQLGKIEDLEECISLNRDALGLHPPGHPLRSLSLNSLANVLKRRYQKLANTDDFHEMFALYEQAATDSPSYLKDQLMAAIHWAMTARRHQHESTLNAYTTSLQLLHQSLVSRLNVEEQHTFLTATNTPRSLASDAASAAIQAGNLELAVEFLEQGRSMLWSRVDGYKSPLEQLRQVEPDGEQLADQFETIGAQLEHLVLLSGRTATIGNNRSAGNLSFDVQIKQHRLLSEQWDDLVERIREKEGFAYFLKIPPFHTLRCAASDGPVILINISEYRSDAIILTADAPPTLVPLPDVALVELGEQAGQLVSKQGVISVLRYLWDKIVSPVVACLSELGVKTKSRIWWCPTGALCALPIHAAGPYRPRERSLPDIYTSSYTSTLTSLIRARSDRAQLPGVQKLLVVGQPHETLQKVGDEVKIIIEQYGGNVDVLLGSEASHEAVLEGLKAHSCVHFACHGHLGDNNQPFRASFELDKDRRLTLLELIQARLPNAEWAFLAACHSAAGDARTPDESIHLSAALQFCGFRSVVGTLWEMFDDDGPRMSTEFYKYMFRDRTKIDFRDSAYALSSAVKAMRKVGLGPEHWAMFVHIGA